MSGLNPGDCKTMKKPHIISLVVVLALAGLIAKLSLNHKSYTDEAKPGKDVAGIKTKHRNSGDEKDTSENNTGLWNMSAADLKLMKSTEADLYGLVLDQYGQPVPDAEIVGQPTLEIDGEKDLRRFVTRTAQDGTFHIKEPNCPSLSVVAGASGYYTSEKGIAYYDFGEPPASLLASLPPQWRENVHPPTRTSAGNPAVLVLKKMANSEPMLKTDYCGVLKEQQILAIGLKPEQKLQVKYWFDPTVKRNHPNYGPVYDWGVEFIVENGGLIETTQPETEDSEAYIAPKEGYRPSLRYSFDSSMSDEDWTIHFNKFFFIRFTDGTYARIDTEISPEAKRPWHIVYSYYNPSGNRSTEFNPDIQIKEDKEQP